MYIFHQWFPEFCLIYRHLRMKLNNEKLHGVGFIGKWLNLLLWYELCVLVWLVFFFTYCVLCNILLKMMWQLQILHLLWFYVICIFFLESWWRCIYKNWLDLVSMHVYLTYWGYSVEHIHMTPNCTRTCKQAHMPHYIFWK